MQAESDIRIEISEKFGIEKWLTLLNETTDGEKIVYDGKMKLPAVAGKEYQQYIDEMFAASPKL